MQFTIFTSLAVGLFKQALAGEGWSWQTGNFKYAYEDAGEFIGTAPACQASCGDCTSRGMACWYTVTSGTGSYCSSGRKVYCNKEASPYSGAPWWVGTATFCKGSCGDCGYPAKCVATDGTGDGNSCSCGTCCFGCTNTKAMCVRYADRRRLQETGADTTLNFTDIVNTKFKGVDIGFYIYYGDEFEDDSIFEASNGTLHTAFIAAVSSALTSSVSGVTTTAALGSVREYGFAGLSNVDSDYAESFGNASLVTYINLQFTYATEDEAANVETYLDEASNKGTFSDVVTTELGSTAFSDLPYSMIEAHFVEANTFVSTLEAVCDAIEGQADGTSKPFIFANSFGFQFLVLLSIWRVL